METRYEEIWQTDVALIRAHLITERLRKRLEEDRLRITFNEAAAIRHHLVHQQNYHDRNTQEEEAITRSIRHEAGVIRQHLRRNQQARNIEEEMLRRTNNEADRIRNHLVRHQHAWNMEHHALTVNHEAPSVQQQLPWEENGHARTEQRPSDLPSANKV